ncbi:ankyrin-related portein [Talaromyces pinophilus]|uniref:Ankyrin-related portein n=1 Tax=Talaromyces pinophilus TaxID=128442 RepID=A0A6V8GZ53_TALPI|nr:ankyrin-related portein [Talaromyces pinophilus]
MEENEHAHTEAAPSAEREYNMSLETDNIVPNIDHEALLCSHLSEGITSGDFEKVKELLDRYPHLAKARYSVQFDYGIHFGPDKQEGVTALIQAAAYPEMRTLELFLQKGADANEKTISHGSSPLHMAARFGHWENFKLLIDSGAKIDSRTKSQRTVLHQAAYSSDIRFCDYILNLDGADANVVDHKNCTPIFLAAQEGHSAVVQFLIQHNADVNIACDDGETALIRAASEGHIKVVELLVQHGANMNLADGYGTTALSIAASVGHLAVVELLVQLGANINLADSTGATAFFIAAQTGRTKIVETLISHSEIDVNMVTNIGATALYIAAQEGHIKIVELLLACNPKIGQKNVNRNAVTTEGYTAIHAAAAAGHADVFNRLISDHEVDLTISSHDGYSVLSYTVLGLSNEDTLCVLKAPAFFPDDPLKAKLCCARSNERSYVEPTLLEFLDKRGIGGKDIEVILFWAIINDAQGLLRKGLQHKTLDIDSFLQGNHVPLHVAARLGNWEAVQVLVDNGADADSLATHNSMAIHLAAENGHLYTVVKLLNLPTRTSSDDSSWFPRQLRRIIQEDTNGESAISLAVKRQNKSVEEYLWRELKDHGNLYLASSPSHEGRQDILEIAAKYERPGEESVLKSFLQQNKKSPENWTALHWAVSESQPVVVWWLLSKGGIRTKTLQEARNLKSTASNDSDTKIQILLHNPPPILPSIPNNNDNELVQKPLLEDYDDRVERQGTIVDFYSSGEDIEMHFNQKSVKDIIYQQGVKSLMEESRRQNFHKLDFMKEAIQGVQSNETADPPVQQTPKRPNEPEGPSKIRHGAKIQAFDPSVTQITGDIDGSKERRFSGPPVFRWVHIPLNDMKLLEDLVTRISADEKKTQKDHRPLMQFLQESWAPCAVGGEKHYMKSQCVQNETFDQDRKLTRTAGALYARIVPYLILSEGELKTNKGSSERASRLPIHETMTLDQYYYVSLTDTNARDNDQVLHRYLDRYHEKKEQRMQMILVVGDLWLWIVDDTETIITATTDQYSAFADTVFETIAWRESSGKRLLPKSVDDMVKLVLGMQTTYFPQENIPLNSTDSKNPKKFKSVLNVFRESIRDVAEKESELYDDFLKALDRDKRLNSSKTPDHNEDKRLDSYNNIEDEVRLLREIKDIRDELGILVTLVDEQKMVWKQFFQTDSPKSSFLDDGSPESVREDLIKMISDANLVVESINSLLDLRQKQATIKEAEWGRKQAELGRRQQETTSKQSNIIMVFTVVTIIFLPLSFLSSLFALNISDFPHEGDSVAYEGWWIFPIIFGTSAAVSLPLIWVAFNVNSLLDWFQDSMNSEPKRREIGLERPESEPERPWRPQEDSRPMLRILAEKARLRSPDKRIQSTEKEVPV